MDEHVLSDISETPEMDDPDAGETADQAEPSARDRGPGLSGDQTGGTAADTEVAAGQNTEDNEVKDESPKSDDQSPSKSDEHSVPKPNLNLIGDIPVTTAGSTTSVSCSTPRADTVSVDISLPRSSVSKTRRRIFKKGPDSVGGDKESHCSGLSNRSLLRDSMLDLQEDPSDDGFHITVHTVISPLTVPSQSTSQPGEKPEKKVTGRFSVSPVDGIPISASVRSRPERTQTVSESSVAHSGKMSPDMAKISREPSIQFRMSDMSLLPEHDKQHETSDQHPLMMDYFEAGRRYFYFKF